jgi:hypothetical protein
MATLKLTDAFGVVVDATLDPGSVLAKYLKSPQALIGVLRTAKPLKDLSIGDDPFSSQTIGITFTDPIALGTTGVELTIKPTLTGSTSISKGAALFDADTDPFRQAITIPTQHAYVSAVLHAELDVTLADKVTDLQFGFTAGTTIIITNYQLCALMDPVMSTLERVFREFTIPGDLQDIEQLTEHTVVTLEGTGSLQCTAQANLFTIANPLATLNTPLVPIKVAEGSGVTINGTYELTGDYQLRIERLAARAFRVSYLKKRITELDVSVQAQLNTSVSAGSFDLLKSVLQAVSSDPVPDVDTFHQAGLTEDQLTTIAAAVKAGIERSIALSLTGDLDSLVTSSTAFTYDVDLALLDDAGRKAVHDALDGNLTGLEASAHPGITRRTSIIDALRQGQHVLKVNLLGIYTHASVTTLFQQGTVIVDRESGDLTITDQAGAARIQFTADNFAKDSAKLRQVLAESLLLTAAYRSTGGQLTGPQLASHYWFFALHEHTNREQCTDYFTIAQALHLLNDTTRSAMLARLAGATDVGQSTFFIDASYTDDLCMRLFVDASGEPRLHDEYESLGRRALLLLLPAGDSINDARRLPLLDDTVWQAMQQAGQPGFPNLFAARGFNLNQLADITSDYTLITWWASSMHHMGEALAAIRAFLAMHPGVDRENNTFKQLRRNLENAMASVVSNTQAQFGEPWGLLALDLTTGQQATTSVQLMSPRLTFVSQRQLQSTTHGD